MTPVVKGLYHVALLSGRDGYDVLRDVTRRQVAANRLQSCVVIDAGTALYVRLDGTEERSANLPRGAAVVTCRLRLCREMSESTELDVRRVRLDAFIERHTPRSGYLLGDVSKGGRPAEVVRVSHEDRLPLRQRHRLRALHAAAGRVELLQRNGRQNLACPVVLRI